MIRRFVALFALAAIAAPAALAQAQPQPAASAIPQPAMTLAPIGSPPPNLTPPPALTPPPLPSGPASPGAPLATPQPSPLANLVDYTGQLLDVRDGYVYFTTGDAFKTVPVLRVVEYDSGQPTTLLPRAKMFARATFDPATKDVLQLAITTRRLPTTQNGSAVQAFVVTKSTPQPAAELANQPFATGKQVAVVFEVTAPPTTALTDTLYITTDAGDWNPQQIKLDRINAYQYRAERYYASGTKFAYLVTRGSWNSVERGEDGLTSQPHQFFVREVDALAARVTVYHWSDENASQQGVGPQAIPTPFSGNPFGGGPGGIAVPQLPTPFPTRHP